MFTFIDGTAGKGAERSVDTLGVVGDVAERIGFVGDMYDLEAGRHHWCRSGGAAKKGRPIKATMGAEIPWIERLIPVAPFRVPLLVHVPTHCHPFCSFNLSVSTSRGSTCSGDAWSGNKKMVINAFINNCVDGHLVNTQNLSLNMLYRASAATQGWLGDGEPHCSPDTERAADTG